MKKLILLAVFHLAASVTASAALFNLTFNSGFDNSGNVPDGNVNPWSDTRTVSGTAGLAITDVSLRLNLSGGFNGDLYAYLSYNGVLVPLLNRLGVGSGNAFGYGDAGLNVTFTDAAAHNVHFYQSVLGYSITGGAAWQPDGRTIDPVTSLPAAFNAAGTTSLAAYGGMSADGNWTLVMADVSAGGGQSTVVSWGLDITAAIVVVPEPAATGAVAGAAAAAVMAAALWDRRRVKQGAPSKRLQNQP